MLHREVTSHCNRKQIQNHRPKDKANSTNIDSLAILLQECKRQQMSLEEDVFIREVTGARELRCVLGFDWQLKQIEHFCTDPKNFTVLTADPTFNLGKFNVTVMTYRHLKVITRRIGHHPIMLGPLFISQTKTSDAYNYFLGKLAALNNTIRNVLAIGTDGEEALIVGMRNTITYAIHLSCFGHFKDNCKQKLRQSNVPQEMQQECLDDIFGRKKGEVFEKVSERFCRFPLKIIFYPIRPVRIYIRPYAEILSTSA